jgi:hypothetical protein
MLTAPSQHPGPLIPRFDGRGGASTVRWQREVPEAIRSLGARELSFASFIRYDRRPAEYVWPPISLIHRQVALALVRSAIRTQQ